MLPSVNNEYASFIFCFKIYTLVFLPNQASLPVEDTAVQNLKLESQPRENRFYQFRDTKTCYVACQESLCSITPSHIDQYQKCTVLDTASMTMYNNDNVQQQCDIPPKNKNHWFSLSTDIVYVDILSKMR